jgi:hypothetical protein
MQGTPVSAPTVWTILDAAGVGRLNHAAPPHHRRHMRTPAEPSSAIVIDDDGSAGVRNVEAARPQARALLDRIAVNAPAGRAPDLARDHGLRTDAVRPHPRRVRK